MGSSGTGVNAPVRSLDKEYSQFSGLIGNLANEIATESMPKIAGASANLQMLYNPQLYNSQVESLTSQIGSTAPRRIQSSLDDLNPYIAGTRNYDPKVAKPYEQKLSQLQRQLNSIQGRNIDGMGAGARREKLKDIGNVQSQISSTKMAMEKALGRSGGALSRADAAAQRLFDASAPLGQISNAYAQYLNRDMSRREGLTNEAISAYKKYAGQAEDIAGKIGAINYDEYLRPSINATNEAVATELKDYRLGGRLSDQEYTRADQAVRSALSDRGMASSNAGIFAEALNRDYLQRGREQERLSQLLAAQGAQTGVAGQRLAGNLGLLQAQLGALGYGPEALRMALGVQSDQDISRLNELSSGAQYFGNLAGVASGENARNFGIQQAYLGQSVNPVLGSAIGMQPYVPSSGVAGGIAAQPLMGYSSNLYSGNQQAALQASIANSQARTAAREQNIGLVGDAVSSIGSIAGAALAFCWVARVCLGTESEDWTIFRRWMFRYAPKWFFNLYVRYGEDFSIWLRQEGKIQEYLRNKIRAWMITKVDFMNRLHPPPTKFYVSIDIGGDE